MESPTKSDEFDGYGTYLNSKPLDNLRIKMIQTDLAKKADVNRALEGGVDILIQAATTTSGAKDIASAFIAERILLKG